jgi:NAD(P)H-hydrate epimerase
MGKNGLSGINNNCRYFLDKILTCGIIVKELDLEKDVSLYRKELENDITNCNAVLECILGTGFVPGRREETDNSLYRVFEIINENSKYTVSADVAAGVNGENGETGRYAVCADETITFSYLKPGQVILPGKAHCGKVTLVPVKVPEEAYNDSVDTIFEVFGKDDLQRIRDLLPVRDPSGHKGTFGKVLVIAGSEGMTGAAILAARACIRSGAGLCYLAAPRGLLNIYETAVPEIVKVPLGCENDKWLKPDFYEQLVSLSEGMDAILIGPGVGRREETQGFIKEFLQKCPCGNIIVDADGLRALAENAPEIKAVFENKNVVMTPHWGEITYLLGDKAKNYTGRLSAAGMCSKTYGAVTVLKGNDSITYKDEKNYTVNATGNSGMATGGSGDVLSGIIASFLAVGMTAYDAARVGVFVHGLAGDFAKREKTEYCMTAGDVIDYLSDAFRTIIEYN